MFVRSYFNISFTTYSLQKIDEIFCLNISSLRIDNILTLKQQIFTYLLSKSIPLFSRQWHPIFFHWNPPNGQVTTSIPPKPVAHCHFVDTATLELCGAYRYRVPSKHAPTILLHWNLIHHWLRGICQQPTGISCTFQVCPTSPYKKLKPSKCVGTF